MEEMITLTTRIEGVLNWRPFTATSNDPNGFDALIGQQLTGLPERDVSPMFPSVAYTDVHAGVYE